MLWTFHSEGHGSFGLLPKPSKASFFPLPCESESSLLQFIKAGVLDCHLSKFKQGQETNDSEVVVHSIYGERTEREEKS